FGRAARVGGLGGIYPTSPPPPAGALTRCLAPMTRPAKRLQVARVEPRAALAQRHDVIDLLRRHHPPLRHAMRAERMRREVRGAETMPSPVVAPLRGRRPPRIRRARRLPPLRPRPPVGPRMLVTPPRPRGRQPPASGRRAGPRNLREGILARQLFPHSTSQTADRSSTVSATPASTARMPATMRRMVLRVM